MFAWILKTKPEKSSRVGSTGSQVSASVCAQGPGARRRNSLRKGSTPTIVNAEPKNTGESLPVSTASRSNSP